MIPAETKEFGPPGTLREVKGIENYSNGKEIRTKKATRRLYHLDYLRGLAAFGIMFYHYTSWTLGLNGSESFLTRFGLYGVSTFYILSGLTLWHVYNNRLKMNVSSLISFFKKRIIRIFPLLWIATIGAVSVDIIFSNKFPDITDLILNLTGLFGFLKWDTNFATGAWSLGNELVFYFFFPFFLYISRLGKEVILITSFIFFCIYSYFAFYVIDRESTLPDEWRDYVNPLNQVFLFLSGIVMGLFTKNLQIKERYLCLFLVFALAVFTFMPAGGERIELITGIDRLIFTFCCILICFSFFKFRFKLPKVIHKPLSVLGEISYSLYLLHPFAFLFVNALNNNGFNFNVNVVVSLSIVLSLIMSYFVCNYVEMYLMRWGKKTLYKNI